MSQLLARVGIDAIMAIKRRDIQFASHAPQRRLGQ
jgi:hypothetical protein